MVWFREKWSVGIYRKSFLEVGRGVGERKINVEECEWDGVNR